MIHFFCYLGVGKKSIYFSLVILGPTKTYPSSKVVLAGRVVGQMGMKYTIPLSSDQGEIAEAWVRKPQ